jgi:hypothetical protein
VQSVKNLKVVTQLVLGFSAVIVLLVGLGASCLFEVGGENARVAELRDNWLPTARSSLQMPIITRWTTPCEHSGSQPGSAVTTI